MIVDCVATLRPLFRRILGLGGESVAERNPKNQRPIWPSVNWRHNGRGEDWVVLCELDDANKVNPKRPTTSMQSSDSEEHILGTKIKVTKTILQDITKSEEEEYVHGGCRN